MFFIPGSIPGDVDLIDGDIFRLSALAMNRDCEPLDTMRSFYSISVAPTAFIVLDIIEKHEDVGLVNLVEITTPGDIGGL
jgi:hypothetical protein